MQKPEEKITDRISKLNIRVLNTLSRVQYECLQSQKKIYLGFTLTDLFW